MGWVGKELVIRTWEIILQGHKLSVGGDALRASLQWLVCDLHITIGWRKVKTCQYGSRKWFWPSTFAQTAKPGKICITAVNLLENVINMIWLLLPVSDWPILMIAPGGLLLVVPHLLQSQISFMCGVAKKQITKDWGEK